MIVTPYRKTCQECGKTFFSSSPKRYKHKSCRKNSKLYPRTYYRNKKIVLERDNHKCQSCQTKKELTIHHIDCDYKNNSPSNLITLCKQCHISLHHKYTKQELRISNIYGLFAKKFKYGIFGKRAIWNENQEKTNGRIKKIPRFFIRKHKYTTGVLSKVFIPSQ